MAWTIKEFGESFRYGTLITPYLIKGEWYHCFRVRKKKGMVHIDKTEKIIVALPSFSNSELKAQVGDLVFVHADKTSSLLREIEGKPFFK